MRLAKHHLVHKKKCTKTEITKRLEIEAYRKGLSLYSGKVLMTSLHFLTAYLEVPEEKKTLKI